MTGWLLLTVSAAGLLGVTWVAYPWLVLQIARSRPGVPAAAPSLTRRISVVVATRDPVAAVHARLQDLLDGDWPIERMELIVAVDGDPAPYQFQNLSPLPQRLLVVAGDPPGGKSCTLNAGVRAASGDILVFTDTHQRFAPDAIPRLLAALGPPTFAAVSGGLRIGNPDRSALGRYWRMERNLRTSEARLHSAIGVSGSIYAMRRSLWTPLPPGLILDDLWVPMKLVLDGHRIGYEPNAVADDTRRTTPTQEFSRKVRTLTGNLQLIAWMPAVLLPWRNPVWLQLVGHKLLRLATPYALLGLGIGGVGTAFAIRPELGWAIVGVGLAGGMVALVSRDGPGARLRRGLAWGLAMQGAILVATWNGLRGRWDVWER